MTSISEDGVDTTLKVIDEVVDILGKIELNFDFNPTRRQMEKMQADYFGDYKDSRISLIKAGEEYNNTKEYLSFAREDRDFYKQKYQYALEDKTIDADNLKKIREQSISAQNNYLKSRKNYTQERNDFSQSKVNYYEAASDYYESKLYPKQAWKKYQENLKKESGSNISPELESLKDEVNLDDLGNEELREQLEEFDRRLFHLINEKQGEAEAQQIAKNTVEKVNQKNNNKSTTKPNEVDINDRDLNDTYQQVYQIINDVQKQEEDVELIGINLDEGSILPDPWEEEKTVPTNGKTVSHSEDLNTPYIEHHSYEMDEGTYKGGKNNNYEVKTENLDVETSVREEVSLPNNQDNQIINQGTDKVLEVLETNRYETDNSVLERNGSGGVSIWTKENDGSEILEFHSDAEGNISSSLSEEKTQQFVEFYQEKLDLNLSNTPDINYQKAEDKFIDNGLDMYLTEKQTNRYETNNYTIERNDEGGLDIKDKLGDRGTIFHSDGEGNIENKMLLQESEDFTNFAVQVEDYADNKIKDAVDKFMKAQNVDSYETASFDFHKSLSGLEIINKDGSSELTHEQTKQLLEFSNKINQVFANNEIATATVGKIKEETEEQER
ncbi:MAG: hypothetical protein F6K22_02395 [Okeania sp. SIO2F4]|uniref:hypothetical protein n=1 Tax=Okeania sp. SIO2F4 TaxID=2607790 RepID=UPI00142C81AF|nr:hypothetical protein [Okeania sp. SIO2F4]NES01773.1 hypothetical protein [Okeania sp. SIO2F4]